MPSSLLVSTYIETEATEKTENCDKYVFRWAAVPSKFNYYSQIKWDEKKSNRTEHTWTKKTTI